MISSDELIDESINQLGSGNSDWSESYILQHRQRFIKDLNLIRTLLPAPHMQVADLGAAPFVTPLAIQNLGHHIECFDIDPSRFQYADLKGLNVHQLDLDNWQNTSSNAYDLIILTEVFEHLKGNLIVLAKNILKLLKPGGKLYLTTPNFRSVTGIYKFLFKQVSYAYSKDLYLEWDKINTVGHMGHVREYTYHELIEFFEKCGYVTDYSGTQPALLGPGWKNKLFFNLERIANPMHLGGSGIFVFSKAL